jgi:hypothetical protein
VIDVMAEPAEPGLMSATIAVPAAVPSLIHSSLPWIRSSAANSKRSWKAVSPVNSMMKPDGTTSNTNWVPAAVPSLRQSE